MYRPLQLGIMSIARIAPAKMEMKIATIDPEIDREICQLYGTRLDDPVNEGQGAYWADQDDVWRVIEFDK